MSKIIVYIYSTFKLINPFTIGYMVNPTLHVNKAFREQVVKFLRETSFQSTISVIINVMGVKEYVQYCNINVL